MSHYAQLKNFKPNVIVKGSLAHIVSEQPAIVRCCLNRADNKLESYSGDVGGDWECSSNRMHLRSWVQSPSPQ